MLIYYYGPKWLDRETGLRSHEATALLNEIGRKYGLNVWEKWLYAAVLVMATVLSITLAVAMGNIIVGLACFGSFVIFALMTLSTPARRELRNYPLEQLSQHLQEENREPVEESKEIVKRAVPLIGLSELVRYLRRTMISIEVEERPDELLNEPKTPHTLKEYEISFWTKQGKSVDDAVKRVDTEILERIKAPF